MKFSLSIADIERVRAAEQAFATALRSSPPEQWHTPHYTNFHSFIMQNYLGHHFRDDEDVDKARLPFARDIPLPQQMKDAGLDSPDTITLRDTLRHQWANIINMPAQSALYREQREEAIKLVCLTSQLFDAWQIFWHSQQLTPEQIFRLATELASTGRTVHMDGFEAFDGHDFKSADAFFSCFLILSELITNVVKHSPPDTAISVKFANEQQVELRNGKEVAVNQFWVAVRDHGTGIPLELQRQILAGKYRAKDSDVASAANCGFGLKHVICKADGVRITSPLFPDDLDAPGMEIQVLLPLW